MVLPLVPLLLIAGSVVTGAGGAAFGTWGGIQISRAKKDMVARAAKYEERYSAHLTTVDQTNDVLQLLGRTQLRAQTEVINRMKAFLERNAKQVRAHEHLILDGVGTGDQPVAGLSKLDSDSAGWVSGVIGSTMIGVGTPLAIRTGVVGLASASTGTAISALSGAAATNATLAWLGGGALAAGGGGMALGAVVINVAAVGPTMLVAGITVKNRGTKAKSEAATHETQTAVATAELDARDGLLAAMQVRAREVDSVLGRLITGATASLDTLESEAFDMTRHAERLQTSLILVKAVRDVATAHIANEDGTLNEQTGDLVLKFREPTKESTHG